MPTVGIARQIEAPDRVRAGRDEAEYLANILGLDCELPARDDQSAAKPARRGRKARSRKEMPLFDEILSAVGEATHVTPSQMRGRSRLQRIAHARQLAMYLMRQVTRASYPRIGEFLGRHHSTVIHGCESMRWGLPFDVEGRRALDKIATIFKDRRRQLQNDGDEAAPSQESAMCAQRPQGAIQD